MRFELTFQINRLAEWIYPTHRSYLSFGRTLLKLMHAPVLRLRSELFWLRHRKTLTKLATANYSPYVKAYMKRTYPDQGAHKLYIQYGNER